MRAGARVALLSPAGPLRGREELDRARETCASLGWRPVVHENAMASAGYFAGDDASRAADLQNAIDDPEIDAIWCLRGGYGSARLLEHVRWTTLRDRPRPFIGFSDITALHLAVAHECGVISYHGPTARSRLSAFSRDSLLRALGGADPCGDAPSARVLRPGNASGRLAGGNLAVLASLVGTKWSPRFDGAIAVLEDINEATYRVDRMLLQLRLAGTFEGCVAIAFGHCTSCDEEADGGGRRALNDVIMETADRLDVPCVVGIPVGHIDDQWTLPLGADAHLSADDGRVRLSVPSDTPSV